MESHSEYAMQLVSASLVPMVLKAAIELGVLDIIHRAGPGAQLSSSEIASQLHPQNLVVLDRMLCLLSAHSILTCSVSADEADPVKVLRLYGLAPTGKYFIPDQDGGSLATLLSFCHDKVNIHSWYHLKDVVLEGGLPFTKAYGMSVVEYNTKDARYGETFKKSMKEFNPVFMKEILESYKGFEGLSTLVDAGGGDGTLLNMIVSKYPTIKGINYDLPAAIEKSPSYPGIEHVAGDIFVNIPKGDAIFMKWILHHYDDDRCLTILKNCYEALPDHGKVIVVDMVIPEAPETTTCAKSLFQFDMFLMNMNTTGNERTKKELNSLAKQAGFHSIRVACSAFNFSVTELFKNISIADTDAPNIKDTITNRNHLKMESHSQHAMQLVSASLVPMVLKAAIELGVLDIIHRTGPGALLSPSQIASQLPSQNNPDAPIVLDRMLRLLSAHSILTCSVSTDEADHIKVLRVYGLAPVAEYFIPDQDGASLATLLKFCNHKVNTDSWYYLADAVLKGGIPYTQAYGRDVVEYLQKDAEFGEIFKRSMKELNPILMKEILENYKGFEGISTLVDVGGGDGTVLSMIVSKYPTIKGINYDLAPVIGKSSSYPGIEQIAGDMFVKIPKGDAIFIKWVLHLFDDKQCLVILKNCYEALPDQGKVMVVNLVIKEAPETAKSLFQFDMFLMNTAKSERQRTEKEFESLAKQAGFYTTRVASSAFNFSVVELFKSK